MDPRKAKKAKVQQEPGSSPSFLHHTPSTNTAELATVSARFSDEKNMNITPPLRPVAAIVLSRAHRDADTGTVLIARDEYYTFLGPRNTEYDITQASHLAQAAKPRAARPDERTVGKAVVSTGR